MLSDTERNADGRSKVPMKVRLQKRGDFFGVKRKTVDTAIHRFIIVIVQ
jgi:hypothetical protein